MLCVLDHETKMKMLKTKQIVPDFDQSKVHVSFYWKETNGKRVKCLNDSRSANVSDNTDSADEANHVDGGVRKESKRFPQERKEVVALSYRLSPWKNFEGETENILVTYGGEVKRWLFYSWPHFLWSLCVNTLAKRSILITLYIPCQCCLQVDQETCFRRPDSNHSVSLTG